MISETCDHLQRSTRRQAARGGVAAWLESRGFPRVAVGAVLLVSSAVGVGCSSGLHRGGISHMALRFPIALIAAYVAFLLLLGALVACGARRINRGRNAVRRESLRRQIHNDSPDPPELSDWFDTFLDASREAQNHGGNNRMNGLPAYLMILLAGTIVLICVYFVWIAPMLLAELIVEGAMVTWLYRPIPRGHGAHWLTVSLERTAIPALAMAACFTLIGVALEVYFPGATTVVDVWRRVGR